MTLNFEPPPLTHGPLSGSGQWRPSNHWKPRPLTSATRVQFLANRFELMEALNKRAAVVDVDLAATRMTVRPRAGPAGGGRATADTGGGGDSARERGGGSAEAKTKKETEKETAAAPGKENEPPAPAQGERGGEPRLAFQASPRARAKASPSPEPSQPGSRHNASVESGDSSQPSSHPPVLMFGQNGSERFRTSAIPRSNSADHKALRMSNGRSAVSPYLEDLVTGTMAGSLRRSSYHRDHNGKRVQEAASKRRHGHDDVRKNTTLRHTLSENDLSAPPPAQAERIGRCDPETANPAPFYKAAIALMQAQRLRAGPGVGTLHTSLALRSGLQQQFQQSPSNLRHNAGMDSNQHSPLHNKSTHNASSWGPKSILRQPEEGRSLLRGAPHPRASDSSVHWSEKGQLQPRHAGAPSVAGPGLRLTPRKKVTFGDAWWFC